MDFSHFDTRNYPTIPVQEGYGAWASSYEDTVLDLMDLRLLERIKSVAWDHIDEAADLGCGTGRTGAWLKQQGVTSLDGVDLTAEMLEGARARSIYRRLFLSDIRETPLQAAAYDLVTVDLVDEHLPDVRPLYQESARIARPNGYLVLVGYHPFFLMGGIPTHFNRAPGEPVAIQTYIHLLSDHVQAALAAGWFLLEMYEALIDDAWLTQKPKWGQYRNRPISFAMVWRKQRQ